MDRECMVCAGHGEALGINIRLAIERSLVIV